jgi:tRNA A37 threonylcarbamoyladenosine synthetase subunit TsaC/SUA5/YrdC
MLQDHCKSTLAKDPIYLTQTDTTVGFLSHAQERLNLAKGRPVEQPCLLTLSSFLELHTITRVPKQHRKKVRNAKRTTFVYPNQTACRVVDGGKHVKFLKKYSPIYSTSANLTGSSFDIDYTSRVADIIVTNKEGLSESGGSTIYRLGKRKFKRLR